MQKISMVALMTSIQDSHFRSVLNSKLRLRILTRSQGFKGLLMPAHLKIKEKQGDSGLCGLIESYFF